jgi:hypothetical protein
MGRKRSWEEIIFKILLKKCNGGLEKEFNKIVSYFLS